MIDLVPLSFALFVSVGVYAACRGDEPPAEFARAISAIVAIVIVLAMALAVELVRGQSISADEVREGLRSAPPVLPRRRVPRIRPEFARAERAVAVARVAVVEASLQVVAGEVAAIDEVIETRTAIRRSSYQSTAWAYSVGVRNPRKSWVHRLGREPLSESWAPMIREHWPRVLRAADAAVAGENGHGCDAPGPLAHWGGPRVDRASLAILTRRRGYVRAECPGFANVFLARRARR